MSYFAFSPMWALRRALAIVAGAGLMLAVGTTYAMADDTPDSITVTETGSSDTVDGAIVFAAHDNDTVTGTGTFEPFVRVGPDNGDDGRQRGYNTEGTVEFGTDNSPTHRDCVSPDEIPLVSIGGVEYWEFALDLNEADSGDQPLIDIIDLELYATDDVNITDYPFDGTATLLWETEETIHMRYPGTGQGRADYLFYIPASELDASIECLVLYSEFDNFDASFEEWKRRSKVFDASKTAAGTYDETYTWDLAKSADPASQDIFAGDDGNVDWQVVATRTGPEQTNFEVSGTVTLENNGERDATVSSVDDEVDGVPAILVCTGDAVAAGETYQCSYSATATSSDPGTNEVVFHVDSGATLGDEPIYIVVKATDDYTFSPSGVVSNGSGQLADTQIGLDESIGDSATRNGSTNHTCSSNPADYTDGSYVIDVDNTATLDTDSENLEAMAEAEITCWMPSVSKTAEGTFANRVTWDIEKTSDATYTMLAGETINHEYDISVDKTVTPEGYSVSGTVSVTNPSPLAMTVSLADVLSDETEVVTQCGPGLFEVAAETTVDCGYGPISVTGTDVDQNTATLSFNGIDQDGSAEISYTLGQTIGYDKINVTDDNGSDSESDDRNFGPFDADDSVGYNRDYECPTDVDLYNDGSYSFTVTNVALINETTQTDNATVTVNCYIPSVLKTAATSFTRTYNWVIEKDAMSADGTPVPAEGLELNFGQGYSLEWKITAGLDPVEPYTDSDWMIDGVISVTNPSPLEMADVNVSDSFAWNGSSTALIVDCDPIADGAQDTITLTANSSVQCTYSHSTTGTSDGADGTNTARATITTGVAVSDDADVSFADANATITSVDATVQVTDTFDGSETVIGTVAFDEAPQMFSVFTMLSTDPTDNPDYLLDCGMQDIINRADVETLGGATLGYATRTVKVTVNCVEGCTLTQGYWRTHNDSFWGGAPTDETWELIGDADGDGVEEGENEMFFDSGQTWFEVMWTPTQGNPYYQLAHQYIAAVLNGLDGADQTAVAEELSLATGWLTDNTPESGSALKGRDARTVRTWASTLDAYNNGEIGPGHCDEDKLSE